MVLVVGSSYFKFARGLRREPPEGNQHLTEAAEMQTL